MREIIKTYRYSPTAHWAVCALLFSPFGVSSTAALESGVGYVSVTNLTPEQDAKFVEHVMRECHIAGSIRVVVEPPDPPKVEHLIGPYSLPD